MNERNSIFTPTRRALLKGGASLLAAPAVLAAGAARAEARKEVVVVNYGGAAMKAFDEAYVQPFAAQGGRMVLDGSGPLNGKILTMVQSRNVTWDICIAASRRWPSSGRATPWRRSTTASSTRARSPRHSPTRMAS